MKCVARKVSGSSITKKPLRAKAMIEKPKKAKPTSTMETLSSPSSVIEFKDDDQVMALKSRFASTILKAQQQLSQTERIRKRKTYIVEKKPPTLMTSTKERREAILKASSRKKKPPTPTKTMSIEELRKAARNALEELERSVDVDDSHQSVKNLERLCGWPIPYVGGFKNRMEYYGLYLRTDDEDAKIVST